MGSRGAIGTAAKTEDVIFWILWIERTAPPETGPVHDLHARSRQRCRHRVLDSISIEFDPIFYP
jgi:hypothetical protein